SAPLVPMTVSVPPLCVTVAAGTTLSDSGSRWGRKRGCGWLGRAEKGALMGVVLRVKGTEPYWDSWRALPWGSAPSWSTSMSSPNVGPAAAVAGRHSFSKITPDPALSMPRAGLFRNKKVEQIPYHPHHRRQLR